ncbi:wnt-activated inhibitory factor 2 [Alosa sapidissima]|uniref:wnt-activated inhibitory factor 2 n=1 Tax=Alosa sapidissima TaxID=34773 RepID=UPI001C092741|nr:wnt-activated inhibitory factor 2 [Alosa sapidissima]
MGCTATWFFNSRGFEAFCPLKKLCICAALLGTVLLRVNAENCPWSCSCINSTATVSCLDSQETEIPGDIPPWVNVLILRGNNVSTLPEFAFTSNGTELELVTLLMSHNNIQTIEPYAFWGLPRLQLLDLSHNRLVAISEMAFYGLEGLRYLHLNDTLTAFGARQLSSALSTESLRNLHTLELSGNRLKTVPLARLDTLDLHALVLTNNFIEVIGKENVTNFNEFGNLNVFLAQNPFRCTCDIEAFYHWLKNSSQCPDSHRLLCAQPDGKRGIPVEKLHHEDVDCRSAELEAVSYVFLGIVLALIGVVFLMVLYLNRKGIKRWLNNIREACRDQMEVYHYRYEQDSDPRLANVAV